MAEECRDEGHGGLAAISALFGQVGVDCPEELLAAWSQQAMADGKQVGDLQALMERIVRRRNEHRIGMLLQTSRLPQVARKTFANYDLGRLSGENGKWSSTCSRSTSSRLARTS